MRTDYKILGVTHCVKPFLLLSKSGWKRTLLRKFAAPWKKNVFPFMVQYSFFFRLQNKTKTDRYSLPATRLAISTEKENEKKVCSD